MTLTTSDLSRLTKTAQSAVLEAGDYIQSQFSVDYTKERKVGGDSLASQVVTEVDLKAQEIIIKHLKDSIDTYDFGLLTEEASDNQSRLEKDYFWCIDPLDGTMPFTERRTGYSVSIALISKAGDPIVGVVYIPDLKACYTSSLGSGVSLNDRVFLRSFKKTTETLHFYMDQSFLAAPYFEWIKEHFEKFVERTAISQIQYHSDFGGVRNAIGVLSSPIGCYFKFPKHTNGCGSIWDYAATRLFMQELGLPVSSARGDKLHLNSPETTFMNHQGVLYATDSRIADFVVGLANELDGDGRK